MKFNDIQKLFVICFVAGATRIISLWIGQPEFSGWLNHTYYYFVQVRGILEQGDLPYNDMPFLFYVYALVAKLFNLFGAEQTLSIVNATRFIMCLTLAVMPFPFYCIMQRVNVSGALDKNQWMIIFLTGFMPLTVRHGPEFSQKNMLGLLLLAFLMSWTLRLLERWQVKDMIVVSVLAFLIVMTHYGTFAAMVLYGFAALLAYAMVHKNKQRVFVFGMVLCLGVVLASVSIFVFDAQRYARIFVYLNDSLAHSLLYALFSGGHNDFETRVSVGGIFFFYGVLFWFFRIYQRNLPVLVVRDQIFWLCNILFCGLLILPIWDQHLMGRLALFLSVPLIVIFIYHDRYGFGSFKLKTGLHIVMLVGVVTLAVGEVVSAKIHNRHHKTIYADIQALQTQLDFGAQDFVITPTGAEHICNWFLGVKAGVITSLHIQDFEVYDHIYVLNPIQGKLNFEGLKSRRADTEANRYFFMRRNIPRPQDNTPLFRTQNIEVFRLDKPPNTWHFNMEGYWVGYSERAFE